MEKKPKILISACLLGHSVRYDGQHKHSSDVEALTDIFQLLPLCPEVQSGLSVPRPAVNLYRIESTVAALGAEDKTVNITKTLNDWSDEYLKNLNIHGAIVKSKSPSCGYQTTPIYSGTTSKSLANGLFTQKFCEYFPELPIIDEVHLKNENLKQQFIQKVWRQFNVR